MKRLLFYTFALFVPFIVMAQQSQLPQYVVFQITPKTATVVIGDKSVATDSDGLAIFKLNNGTYSYVISANEYHNESGAIEVYGSKVVRNVELSPNHGWITIQEPTELKGAKIYVDDALVGEIPIKKVKLSSGEHAIRVVHDKYKELVDKINIYDGEISEYYPEPAPRLGVLDVASTPAMAYVTVDGERIGKTPLMVEVIIGEHKVEVSRGDFGAEPQTVTISEGGVTEVNLILTKIESADYVEVANGLNMKMVYVEGGTFQMGATSEQGGDYSNDERPVHSVTLDSYYIAETEVTQAQWYAVMGNNPSDYSGDNRPVENVSWHDAQAFCDKLSELTGKKYVLPTEAQWEYAARGGNKSQGYKYSGSNAIGDVAWYDGSSSNPTYYVKQKSPNELGLYDMSGNVWEWCSDWYDDYSSYSQTNPTGPSYGSRRILRGGSYRHEAAHSRVSNRQNDEPSIHFGNVGFRVVCLP